MVRAAWALRVSESAFYLSRSRASKLGSYKITEESRTHVQRSTLSYREMREVIHACQIMNMSVSAILASTSLETHGESIISSAVASRSYPTLAKAMSFKIGAMGAVVCASGATPIESQL